MQGRVRYSTFVAEAVSWFLLAVETALALAIVWLIVREYLQ